ncbi:CIA30 family protein [Arenimonas sp. SCN 70-307]|uniref:CIA30 family protein n=1 Tax=Arenimonas sp. SCN 70-307 TaxID=1660089 RepID=UPI0025BB713F|nr:CIA30 family protein [Arenimonas sp. SCN 70-307]
MRPLAATALVLVLALSPAAAEENAMQTLMQFDDGAGEPRWVAVNDGVMGGRSQGGPEVKGGALHFSGVLSLANNGGFSSVRTVGRNFDVTGAQAVVLRVKGDGRTYQLRLATDARFRGITVSWGGEFATVAGQWTEVRVPLATLRPSAHGMQLQGPPMDPSKVRELGLLVGDKREGPFALEVDWIAVE